MPPQRQTTTLARSHGRFSPNTSRKVQCWQSDLALGTCVKQSGIWKEGEEGGHAAQPSLHIPSQYWGNINFILAKPNNKLDAT